jgi:hypothetical protein
MAAILKKRPFYSAVVIEKRSGKYFVFTCFTATSILFLFNISDSFILSLSLSLSFSLSFSLFIEYSNCPASPPEVKNFIRIYKVYFLADLTLFRFFMFIYITNEIYTV